MQHDPRYDDVVAEVHGFLRDRAAAALEAGVGEVWVDPGIGFGKTGGAQPHPAAPSSRARGAGRAGARGDESQELPRAPGGGARGRARRRGRAPGGVHRHRHVGHAGGRVDGPGPRRARAPCRRPRS